MKFERQLARGSAVAYVLVGIVAAAAVGLGATSAVMSLLSSSQIVSAQTETVNRMETVIDELIALALLAPDPDEDGINEVPAADHFDANESALKGGGAVPLGKVGVRQDGFGTLFHYCPRDFGPVAGVGFETVYGTSQPLANLPDNEAVASLISAGANGTRETTCLQARQKDSQGDDIVEIITIAQIQKGHALNIEVCEDENSYNAYNPETGKFECRSLDITIGDAGETANCPPGEIFNGEACVNPSPPTRIFASQKAASLFFQNENNDTPSPEEHYRSLDFKDGILALSYESGVYTWSRGLKDGTWIPGAKFTTTKSGFFGSQAKLMLNKGSKFEHRPQILISRTQDNVLFPSEVYIYNLFNAFTRDRIGADLDTLDRGFGDDVSKIALSLPSDAAQVLEHQSTNQLSSAILSSVAGHHQPDAMAVHEEHTPTELKTTLVLGNSAHDNGKGRIIIYELDNNTNFRFNLAKTINAPAGAVNNQRFGRAVAIGAGPLGHPVIVTKNLPLNALSNPAQAGVNYFYHRAANGTWPSTPSFALPSSVNPANKRYTEFPTPDAAAIDEDDAYQHKIENIAIAGSQAKGVWVAVGEPNNDQVANAGGADNGLKTVRRAGAVTLYAFNKSTAVPQLYGWRERKTIHSPYRGKNIGAGPGQYSPEENAFGLFVDMATDQEGNARFMAVVEPWISSYPADANFDHQYVGLVHLYKNLDADAANAAFPAFDWAPKRVYAKHYEPIDPGPYTGHLLRGYALGPVQVEISGEGPDEAHVAFIQTFDVFGSAGAANCDGADIDCSNVVRYLGVFGPYREDEALFVSDADDLETCPSQDKPYAGSYSGGVTPIAKFGLSKAVNCFAGYAYEGASYGAYDHQAQKWE